MLTTPLAVSVPAPFTVSRNVPLSMLPLSVKAVAAMPIVLAEANVTAPAKVLVPLTFCNTPIPPTPLPLSVTASVVL